MKRISALITAIIICVSVFSVGSLVTSAAEPTTGYCAVGEVDGTRAAILRGDGTVKTVNFTGTAPVAGTVNSYTETNGVYTFSAVTFNGYTGWALWNNMDGNGAFFYGSDGTNDYYAYFAETAAGFMKFSNTEWRVFNGKDMVGEAAKSGIYPANIDGYWDGAAEKITVVYADATQDYSGTNDPKKFMDPTGAGFTTGDKNVVLSNAEDPGTETPDTSDAAVPAAIVVISLCAATVVLVGRKRKV